MSAVAKPALTAQETAQQASRTTGTGRAPFHIPSLDGLRAVSFFIVFAAHAGLDRIVPGGFGVTVFFFLSGYLITTLMRIEVERTGHVSLKNFYLRRALRILPSFYIVLVAATLLAAAGFLHGDAPLAPMPVAAQFLHFSNYWIAFNGWTGIATGTGVYWSLAVEEHFYLVFPAAFLALSKMRATGRQKAFAFWAICAAVLVWRSALVMLLHSNVDRTYLCSDTRIDSIAFGCALAVWRNPILDPVDGTPTRSARRQGVALVAGIGILLTTFLVRAPLFRETLRYTLQGIGLTPLFVAAIRQPQWPIFRPLNWKIARFVGTLSYSLYLVHHVTLSAVEQHLRLGSFARALLALLVSLLIAWSIYRAVERPCARIRRRLSTAE